MGVADLAESVTLAFSIKAIVELGVQQKQHDFTDHTVSTRSRVRRHFERVHWK
jgi:hypothetical protein